MTFRVSKITPLGDISYNRRHDKRNFSRVKSIVKNARPGNSALDIGCNEGYFSRALLESGLAASVSAIEFDPDIVSPDLKNDSRFKLHAGDAVTFPFELQYDLTIYGAVHHHLFAHHGYKQAMRFWLDVIDHTNNQIFLETGQLAEGSRWYWQRALRTYFHTDEDLFFDLLTAIGPRLKDLKIINKFWIHGVQRWLLCIELFPPEKQADFAWISSAITPRAHYARTIGSKRQKLLTPQNDPNATIHQGVGYCVADMADGNPVFCKLYSNTTNQYYEYCIAQQTNHRCFIRPLGIDKDLGLVFPFVDLPTLANTKRHAIHNKPELISRIFSIFEFSHQHEITVEFGEQKRYRLIDIIDLHAGNLFFDEQNSAVFVFDLELFSLDNSYRNNMHLAKMVWRYGERNVSTSIFCLRKFIIYFIGVFLNSTRRPRRRILERTPSIFGYIYIHLRELIDRAVVRILPQYRE